MVSQVSEEHQKNHLEVIYVSIDLWSFLQAVLHANTNMSRCKGVHPGFYYGMFLFNFLNDDICQDSLWVSTTGPTHRSSEHIILDGCEYLIN